MSWAIGRWSERRIAREVRVEGLFFDENLQTGSCLVNTKYFTLTAIKWLPRTPKQALPILALQAAAALAALAPVFFLGH